MSSSAASSDQLVFKLTLCNTRVQNPAIQAVRDDFPEPPTAEELAQIYEMPEPPTAEELAALDFPEPPMPPAAAAGKTEKKKAKGQNCLTVILILLLLPLIAAGVGLFFLVKIGSVVVFLIFCAIFCLKLWGY